MKRSLDTIFWLVGNEKNSLISLLIAQFVYNGCILIGRTVKERQRPYHIDVESIIRK